MNKTNKNIVDNIMLTGNVPATSCTVIGNPSYRIIHYKGRYYVERVLTKQWGESNPIEVPEIISPPCDTTHEAEYWLKNLSDEKVFIKDISIDTNSNFN